jgi:predicted RNA-binding protein
MDKDFKKSVDNWIEGQEFLIEELHLRKEFTINNIELAKKMLKTVKQAIKHEEKQLSNYIKNK